MAGKKKPEGAVLEEKKETTVTPLPDGRMEIISMAAYRLGGPRETYSSAEFTFGLRTVVPDDLVLIGQKTQEMEALIDATNRKRRDVVYAELLEHIAAVQGSGEE